MINHKRLRLTQIALSLSIALAAAPAFAQNTTSAIGGRISGSDGKPAAGATVTIVHTESGSTNNVVTDADGRYVARGLRTGGPYTITIAKDGVIEKKEGVFVALAETSSVDATLGAVQTVQVTGSAARTAIFNKSNMGSGTNLTAQDLAIQASIARNLQDYARIDPRISQTDKERGSLSVAGQNSRYNSMTIDGVAVNDTFGLESNGSPTAKQPISIEAIQSVQVNVANYDVTQKAYTGANINAVTKSGTNEVHGSVYSVFRNDSMVGDRFNASSDTYYDAPKFKETTNGFTLGGPIIKDKLFFFANYEELKSSRSAPVYGPIGSATTNVGITQSAIDSAVAIAKNTYGVDAGSLAVPAGTQLKVKDTLVKLDWNINDDHRASFRYSNTDQSEPIFSGFSATGLALNSQWYNQNKTIKTMVGQLFSDWTPTFSTEFRVSSRDYDSNPQNASALPNVGLNFTGAVPTGVSSTLGGSRFLNFGTDTSRMLNTLGTKTKDVYLAGNWALGAHDLKFGTDFQKNDITNGFLQNVYGSYTFSCVNSSATYLYDGGRNVNCTSGTAAQVEAAVLENFRRGRASSYTYQTAAAGHTLDEAVAKFSMKNYGLFLQDTWSVNNQLTVTGGIRVDATRMSDRPAANLAAAQPVGPLNAAGRATGGFGLDNTHTLDGENLFQPRVGFNYRLDTERPTQIRGGAGLFQGAAATVWMSNPFSNTGVLTRIITCSSSAGACPTTGNLYNPDINNQPTNVAGTTPVQNVDFLANNLKQPSIYKSNLAFEHELPWFGLVVGAEYLYTKNKDAIYYQNLNLGAATRTGTDGRSLYYTAKGYDPLCWNSSGTALTATLNACTTNRAKAQSNAAYGNVLLASRTDGGRGNVATLSLKKPVKDGLGWTASYTYSDATEVSPLTSSVSNSNFNARSILNPNENVASNSDYLVKDSLKGSISYTKRFWSTYKTTFGMFYEGRSGKPFSWTMTNDLNGDGVAGNDLMFIPSGPQSGQVSFLGDTATNHPNEDKFWSYVNSHQGLKKSMGKVTSRNDSFAPWVNSFDMRLSQEVPGFFQGNKGVFALDFFNVGNMINKKWGMIREPAFQSAGGQAQSFVDYVGLDAQGRYIYNTRETAKSATVVRQEKGESQWAIQATVKYEF